MTVEEIKNRVMFQTNNDVDDMDDYLPYLMGYINEGYDRLTYAYAGRHLSDVGTDENGVMYYAMMDDTDVPAIPERYHPAIADFATWLVYRNGNTQKQNRGMAFLRSFEEYLSQIKNEGGAIGEVNGKATNFINIPR